MPSFLGCDAAAVDFVLPFCFSCFDFNFFTFGGVEDRDDEELGAGDADGIFRAVPVCGGFFSGYDIRKGKLGSDK